MTVDSERYAEEQEQEQGLHVRVVPIFVLIGLLHWALIYTYQLYLQYVLVVLSIHYVSVLPL